MKSFMLIAHIQRIFSVFLRKTLAEHLKVQHGAEGLNKFNVKTQLVGLKTVNEVCDFPYVCTETLGNGIWKDRGEIYWLQRKMGEKMEVCALLRF